MSQKKTKSKSKPNDAVESPTAAIERCLIADAIEQVDFESISSQLLTFAASARDASQPTVANAAEVLSQLAELASADVTDDSSDHELAASVQLFIAEHLTTTLGDQQDDAAVARMTAEASSQWGNYLEAFQDFAENTFAENNESDFTESNESDAWDDSFIDDAADSADSGPRESEDLGDYGSQIDLMLSAINHLEAASGESDASPDQAVDQPAELFTDASDSTDHDNDDAAIAALRDDREMLEAYLDDANGCVSSMEKSALALEAAPDEAAPVRQFCRELHTLKGASATVGLSTLATFLHQLESSLEESFDGDQGNAQADTLMSAVDTIRDRINGLSDPVAPVASDVMPDVITKAAATAMPVNLGDGGGDEASIRIQASKLDRLMDMLAELVVLRNRRESHVTEFNRLNEELTRCGTRLRYADDAPQDAASDAHTDVATDASSHAASSVAGEISRDITELGGELRALQKPISRDNDAISRFVRDFRQELMQLRRMPVAGLFQRLQRAARDAAKVEQKEVQVQLLGTTTGLEKELQESLFEPLIHIVRNAVGHGIETPDRRTRAGKSPVGTITLEAKSSSQLLVIEVRDDGNGLDYDAVRKRARDKGLLDAHAIPSEAELAKLIFHPGFSTASEVSELSGRGVGMDVVASAIEQMHGRIEITSHRGQGTTMRFTIPLRSGIEHTMVFRSGGQLFALPMLAVQTTRECVSERENEQTHNLATVLSLRPTSPNSGRQTQQAIVMRESSQPLVDSNGSSRGKIEFLVDEIVGPEEVVVRALPAFLKRHPLFCGVTLSGTGETVLLLDGDRLRHFCAAHFDSQTTDSPTDVSETDGIAMNKRVLVVDDSLSARKNLVRKLTAAGYAITEAGDGLTALDCVRKNAFDLIFTDLDMPQMGGLELLADLKQGPHRDIPVVVVSGRAEQDFRDRAADAGAADYLVKPATAQQLTSVLERVERVPAT